MPESQPASRHPIQVVARRTGLSADVLRAWEKRYGILRPARSEGGRRLYSDDDIAYLRLLKRATAAGRSVGQLVALPRGELEALVREDDAAAESTPPAVGRAANAAPVVDLALSAILGLDGAGLNAVLRRAMIESEAPRFLDDVVVPLLIRVGERWHGGTLMPAHEHLASVVVRGMLADFTGTFVTRPEAPRFLSATLTGQHHEMGAQLAAASAAAVGWRVTYIGADLPAAAIAQAAQQTKAAAVGLSFVHPPADPAIPDELRALRAALASDVVLLAGGAAASSYARALRDARAIVVSDLPKFRVTLTSLAGERPPPV